MAEERRGASPAGEGTSEVKVVDRRRFKADGDPVSERGDEGERAAVAQDAAERSPGPPPERAELERKMAEQAARLDELTRAYASLVEDNKAYRARLEREKDRVVEAERAGVAQALLESADDLERALSAVVGAGEAHGETLRNLTEGVRLSLSALRQRISELGAERIDVVGRPFDPHVAEAVDTVAVADADDDGVVVQEIRPGYRIGDRMLRPARVRVGRLAQA